MKQATRSSGDRNALPPQGATDSEPLSFSAMRGRWPGGSRTLVI